MQPERDLPLAGTYFTYKEVTGTESSVSQFMDLLRIFRRSELIRWTSALLHVVSAPDGQLKDLQFRLIDEFCEQELASKIRELAKSHSRWAVFQRRQLWLVLQFGALSCSEEVETKDFKELSKSIGTICLMASDLLKRIEVTQFPAMRDESDLEWLVTILVAHADHMNSMNWVARAYALWFQSMDDSHVRQKMKKYGSDETLDEVFTKKYGITLAEFFFVVVSLVSTYRLNANKTPVAPVLIERDIWSGQSFTQESKTAIFDMLSVSIDGLAGYLFGTPRQSWANDFSPLLKHPLWEVLPGKFACPDLVHLLVYLVDGIFVLLQDAFGNAWRQIFGDIYEWYIASLIRTFSVESDTLPSTYFDKVKFKGREAEVCDGLMFWGKTAAMCEFKGSRITTRSKVGISITDTVEAIKNAVASDTKERKGVAQIADSIDKVLKGEEVMSRGKVIDLKSCDLIIPVLIWYEESTANHGVRLMLQEAFSGMLKIRGTDTSKIAPLVFLTTFDMEMLEQCTRFEPVEKLIREYAEFVGENPRTPYSMFRWYVYVKFKGRTHPKGLTGERLDNVVAFTKEEHRIRNASGSTEA